MSKRVYIGPPELLPYIEQVTQHLAAQTGLLEEMLGEIRQLRHQMANLQVTTPGLTVESASSTSSAAAPPAMPTAPESWIRPVVGDAVYVAGPPHNPVFRCPITLVDGSKTYGPEAHSKALAKFMAQQYVLEHKADEAVQTQSGVVSSGSPGLAQAHPNVPGIYVSPQASSSSSPISSAPKAPTTSSLPNPYHKGVYLHGALETASKELVFLFGVFVVAICITAVRIFMAQSQLSGTHGSWTNTDDHAALVPLREPTHHFALKTAAAAAANYQDYKNVVHDMGRGLRKLWDDYVAPTLSQPEQPAQAPSHPKSILKPSPSNKEMHAYNGNPHKKRGSISSHKKPSGSKKKKG